MDSDLERGVRAAPTSVPSAPTPAGVVSVGGDPAPPADLPPVATEPDASGPGRKRRRAPIVLLVVGGVLAAAVGALVVFLLVGDGGVFGTLFVADQRVEVRNGPGEAFAVAKDGQEVSARQSIRTNGRGRAGIDLTDRSRLAIAGDTRVTLTEQGDGRERFDPGKSGVTVPARRVLVEEGRVYHRFGAASEGADRIAVGATGAVAFGDRAVVAVDCTADAACTFTVVEGSATVVSAKGEVFRLTAGERLTVADDGSVTELVVLTGADLEGDAFIAASRRAEAEAGTKPAALDDLPASENLDKAALTGTYELTYTLVSQSSPFGLPATSQGTITIDQDAGTYSTNETAAVNCIDDATGSVVVAGSGSDAQVTTLHPAGAKWTDGAFVVTTVTGDANGTRTKLQECPNDSNPAAAAGTWSYAIQGTRTG